MVFNNAFLVALDDLLPVISAQVRVLLMAVLVLEVFQNVFKVVMLQPHDHIGIHLDKTPVAVIGKALIARAGRQSLDRLVVKPEIQDRVHHAGHRDPRPRAHRNQKRLLRIAKDRSGLVTDIGDRICDLRGQSVRIFAVIFIKRRAHFGGDGKTGRHRDAKIAHLGQIGALAAEQVFHFRRALGRAVTKAIDPFVAFSRHHNSSAP